jgi:hypothetical protein
MKEFLNIWRGSPKHRCSNKDKEVLPMEVSNKLSMGDLDYWAREDSPPGISLASAQVRLPLCIMGGSLPSVWPLDPTRLPFRPFSSLDLYPLRFPPPCIVLSFRCIFVACYLS